MRDLDTIKHNLSKSSEHISFYSRFFNMSTKEQIDFIDRVAKEYALEVAKEALKNASENALLLITPYLGVNDLQWTPSVDRQSILSETNIPELK